MQVIDGFNAPKRAPVASKTGRSLGLGYSFKPKAKTRGWIAAPNFEMSPEQQAEYKDLTLTLERKQTFPDGLSEEEYKELNEALEARYRKPNRKERRAILARAPRSIRERAKAERWTTQITKKPHPAYWAQYLPEEEMLKLKEGPPEQLAAAQRYIKNMRKRANRSAKTQTA